MEDSPIYTTLNDPDKTVTEQQEPKKVYSIFPFGADYGVAWFDDADCAAFCAAANPETVLKLLRDFEVVSEQLAKARHSFDVQMHDLNVQLQKAEADAKRYQWMRSNPVFCPSYDEDWIVTYLNNGPGPEAGVCDALFSTLDEAVDFMMEPR